MPGNRDRPAVGRLGSPTGGEEGVLILVLGTERSLFLEPGVSIELEIFQTTGGEIFAEFHEERELLQRLIANLDALTFSRSLACRERGIQRAPGRLQDCGREALLIAETTAGMLRDLRPRIVEHLPV